MYWILPQIPKLLESNPSLYKLPLQLYLQRTDKGWPLPIPSCLPFTCLGKAWWLDRQIWWAHFQTLAVWMGKGVLWRTKKAFRHSSEALVMKSTALGTKGHSLSLSPTYNQGYGGFDGVVFYYIPTSPPVIKFVQHISDIDNWGGVTTCVNYGHSSKCFFSDIRYEHTHT